MNNDQCDKGGLVRQSYCNTGIVQHMCALMVTPVLIDNCKTDGGLRQALLSSIED